MGLLSSIRDTRLAEGKEHIRRLMLARLIRIEDIPTTDSQLEFENRPRVNYFESRNEEDQFPDNSLIDSVHIDQKIDVNTEVETMIQQASDNGLTEVETKVLSDLIYEFKNIFYTSFSGGHLAKIDPLRIELTQDVKPVRVRLRNYTQDQRTFLSKLINVLLKVGHIYRNPPLQNGHVHLYSDRNLELKCYASHLMYDQ